MSHILRHDYDAGPLRFYRCLICKGNCFILKRQIYHTPQDKMNLTGNVLNDMQNTIDYCKDHKSYIGEISSIIHKNIEENILMSNNDCGLIIAADILE